MQALVPIYLFYATDHRKIKTNIHNDKYFVKYILHYKFIMQFISLISVYKFHSLIVLLIQINKLNINIVQVERPGLFQNSKSINVRDKLNLSSTEKRLKMLRYGLIIF